MNEIIEKAENDFLGDTETIDEFMNLFRDVEDLFYKNEAYGIKDPENVLLYERLNKIIMKYREILQEKDRLEKIERDRMRNEFLNTVVECGCGSKIKNKCLYDHERSKKHIAFMNSQTYENQEEKTEILEEGVIECCCGSKIQNICLYNHERSKKHIAFMNSQTYENQEEKTEILEEEVIECCCGSKIQNINLCRHQGSKKHIAFMNSQTYENQEENCK